jgi:hypothetical protein
MSLDVGANSGIDKNTCADNATKYMGLIMGDISGSKKDTSFYIIHYTMNKKTLEVYPHLKEVVEAFNAKLKELLSPNLLQKSINDIYIRSNLTFNHVEYPKYKYQFTMMHDNKKCVIYIKAKDLMQLVLKIAKDVCVNNVRTRSVFNDSENIYIQFTVKHVWFWKLLWKCGCHSRKNEKKVVTYISYDLDDAPVKEIYKFSSKNNGDSAIIISHYEKTDNI